VHINGHNDAGGAPRELDDEEIDGDVFQDDEHDDFEDMENDSDEERNKTNESNREPDDNIPKRVLILPLYSMLSAEEQARVFDKVPEGVRLIVVATNIAETSITIPDISYVVDSGRQKCRNYHAGTGVASYDVMWISRAAADQRAGRAGRTGPGHCYRMYSSSMFSRHMNAFALPEVLTRPLEDVVLAMKAMNVSNVVNFPFPTAPDQGQLDAAVKLLANIGCIDLSNVEKHGGDGEITRLGAAVAKLPLSARHGKMLLVAANAGLLDYAIIIVAVESESSPFQHGPADETKWKDENDSDEDSLDEVDRTSAEMKEEHSKKKAKNKWIHRGGDILAAVHAVGAYTYAGRGAGGAAEKVVCRRFCEENGLNPVLMERIQKMRMHLARLARTRLSNAVGIAAKTGGILSTMPPPNKLQEILLQQVSAILDVNDVHGCVANFSHHSYS
jgi:ATP-dependent RNA helicase DHX37/DHR1